MNDIRRSLHEPATNDAIEESSRAFRMKCLGDAFNHMNSSDQALAQYEAALRLADRLKDVEPLRRAILEPLTCCLIKKHRYPEAQTRAEQLVTCCQGLARDRQLVNFAPLFWAQIELLQIYKLGGQKKKFEQVHESFVPLLTSLMSLRTRLNASVGPAERLDLPARLTTALLSQYVDEFRPKTLAQYLWLTSGYRLCSLPLISWEPAQSQSIAAIVCVHGLGLENRAFEYFGDEMKQHNFAVYAIDARGFGAWQYERGSETVNFDRTLEDIHAVIDIIKERSPHLPVFLLGESMGGALVLRAAADFGGAVNGVIATVPSAERYGEMGMSLRVAIHLLHSPNRPFDIGTRIAGQATSKEELRKLWVSDPIAKRALTPIELIKFNRFMISTQKKCRLINSTPILVVQGLADRLVKPKGSYQMFDNIRSPDRAMLIIGSAEHLIFESPVQSRVLIEGLVAWLNNHLQTTAPGKSAD